ncbi:sigma-54 interaction domain-containing protein [Alkalihalobacillus sp. 1P02AB]|uniref:sigma-54 interaction domain-containing protein n=1 Tax=Alkalihalobacillus sp. 1P02AB TaxID=3132260 RepID=UPI0039A5EF45
MKQSEGKIILERLEKLIADMGLSSANADNSSLINELQEMYKQIDELVYFDFRYIVDQIYDGIYISDSEGKTLYTNTAYSRITGIDASIFKDKYVSDLMNSGYFTNAVTPEVIKEKKQVNAMATIHNGVNVLTTGNPVLDEEGNLRSVVVIVREMTDLLRMQNELAMTKERMLAVEKDKIKNKQEIEHLRKLNFETNFLGESYKLSSVRTMIQKVADLDVTVLITGETGTGKEVVANEIYSHSERNGRPFIKVNCAAIPANLLESELFGYEKGSFTGAGTKGKIGMFELADKGTLLLDEIGEMPIELQSKLLRVIQEKEVTRVGGNKPIKLDVRILAATNRDLYERVKKGEFREDLYYRLNVFPIYIPSLREREGDIEVLSNYFLDTYNKKYNKHVVVDYEGIELLNQYSWPGNVRELQNIIERLVIISETNTIVDNDFIRKSLNINPINVKDLEVGSSLKEIVQKVEKLTIERALKKHGSTRKVAAALKINQSTVVKKAKRLGIKLSDD